MARTRPTRTYLYAVVPPGQDQPIVVEAENWVFGLGEALERVGQDGAFPRLTCEVHPGGMIVAEDPMTLGRWVVYRVGDQPQTPAEPPSQETAGQEASVKNGHPDKVEAS